VPTGLRAVLFVPDQPMPTAQARSVLPDRVSRDDAVFNTGRAALLVSALASGDMAALRVATQDRLHQPYRRVLFPAMRLIIKAALDAGAVGAFLSGAGSTVLALAQGREMTIGFEMADIADKAGVAGEVRVVELSARGAHVVEVG
jgi:homoserine kinase